MGASVPARGFELSMRHIPKLLKHPGHPFKGATMFGNWLVGYRYFARYNLFVEALTMEVPAFVANSSDEALLNL